MGGLPQFISFGEALTDLIRRGEDSWVSVPGGAPWNVARVMACFGVSSAFGGAIGRQVVRVATALGMRVLVCDPTPLPDLGANVRTAKLEEVLAAARSRTTSCATDTPSPHLRMRQGVSARAVRSNRS